MVLQRIEYNNNQYMKQFKDAALYYYPCNIVTKKYLPPTEKQLLLIVAVPICLHLFIFVFLLTHKNLYDIRIYHKVHHGTMTFERFELHRNCLSVYN